MSDFYKKFLLESGRRFNASGRAVGLAAFGKHPGWDDHVEDLGLETDSLIFAKTLLYVNGIGGQIDSGAWEKLDAAQQLPAFKHVFLWQRSGQILLGRLWSSSDGKGRKKYPMVVCLHFIGVTLGWALKQGLPALEELEAECIRATTAAQVRALLERKTASLRAALGSVETLGEYAPLLPEAWHRILQPPGTDGQENFLRVLYQLQSQFGAFAAGTFNTRATATALHAQQIRVPMAGANPEETFLFWTRFFLMLVDASVPLLLTLPLGQGWVDVTAGEPESHDFFSLRVSPKGVPLVSEVPYNLDEKFRAKAATFLHGLEHGATTADLQTAAALEGDTTITGRSGWRKWFGIGAVFLVCAVGAVFLLTKNGKQTAPPNVTASQNELAKSNAMPAVPVETDAAKLAADREKARKDAEAAAALAADQKKKSDALAAAEKIKQQAIADAAAKDQQRRMAEAAQKENDRQLAEAAKQKEEQLAQAAAQEKARQLAAATAQAKELEAAEAATKQKERQLAEAAAKEKAQQIAEQNLKEKEQQAADAAARQKQQAALDSIRAVEQNPATAVATPAPVVIKGEITNSIEMVLVPLPSGIWAGKYEVTQVEYSRLMFVNPSQSKNDRQPVERVSWNAAKAFCDKLTVRERSRSTLPTGMVYQLPTVKQWQEFLDGQKSEVLPGGGLSPKGQPAEVGQSGIPNKYGMYDILGNVWQWCEDGGKGDEKLLKGGSFASTNYEQTLSPDEKKPDCGFRCVLVSQQ